MQVVASGQDKANLCGKEENQTDEGVVPRMKMPLSRKVCLPCDY